MIQMNPVYQTVVVSLLGLVGVFSAVVLHLVRTPQQRMSPLFVLLLFSLLPIMSVFRPGMYQSGDLALHTPWVMSFSISLAEGNLFPQWAADMAGGLGYPAFIFMYQTPYYLASLFHLLGFSFITSTKLVFASAYLLSAVTMYTWARAEFGKKPAFLAAFLYQFAPYYFIQMHFLNSLGQSLAFAMLPLTFWTLRQLIYTLQYRWFVAASLAFALSILTHQTVGIISIPFLIIYGALVGRRLQRRPLQVLASLSPLLLGMLLSTYYWLPVLQLRQFIRQSAILTIDFPAFWQFFVTPWRFGLLLQGSYGEIGWILGYAQWLVVAIFSYLLIKKKIKPADRPLGYFFFASFWVVFVLMQEFTQPVWSLPILNNFRFSTRFMLFALFFVSGMASIAVRTIGIPQSNKLLMNRRGTQGLAQYNFLERMRNNFLIIVLCSIALGATILNWGNRAMLPAVDDVALRQNEFITFVDSSLLPVWFTDPVSPHSRLARAVTAPAIIMSGRGSVEELSRTSTEHRYAISAETPLIIREHTLFFPGWQAEIDGQPLQIDYMRSSWPGVMQFTVPPGEWTVAVRFTNSPSRQMGLWISGSTLVLLVGAGLVMRVNRQQFSRKIDENR